MQRVVVKSQIADYSETLVSVYHTIHCHIPQKTACKIVTDYQLHSAFVVHPVYFNSKSAAILLTDLEYWNLFCWLLSWWFYLTLSPPGDPTGGATLSPENLVPDGFLIMFWLLLFDHNVVVSPFLPHRSVTADTMASIFACRFLTYSCTSYIHLRLQSGFH